MQPTLILVHGLPATGKTTISKEIASKLQLPWISKDVFKERIFEVLDLQNTDIHFSKQLGAASCELMYIIIDEMLSKGFSCVAETYWTSAFAEPAFEKIIAKHGVNLIQIFVTCDHEARTKRFEERASTTRHPAHMDIQRIQDKESSPPGATDGKPLDLPGKLIQVDTTNFQKIDIDLLAEEIRSFIKPLNHSSTL